MSITFQNADLHFSFKLKKSVISFLEKQLSKPTGREIRISYIFCSDEFLLNINRQFLNHDYYTDIITFPLNNTKVDLEAEIYISIDRVKENAKDLKAEFSDELLRVIFHGILHLLGQKDKTKAQKVEMRKLEERWIKQFQVQN